MHIAIIGLGGIGGSLALAIKAAHPHAVIHGYDLNTQHAATTQSRGGIDQIHACAADAVKGANIIFLATPLRAYTALAEAISPHVLPHAIISDVGSAQHCLHDAFAPYAALTVIPSHPIAGSERDGPDAASADLFREKLVLLTPHDPEQPSVKILADFWVSLGTKIVFMPPDLHDSIYAYVSHAPHVLVFAAAACMANLGARISHDNTHLLQFLRIGKSNVTMWTDVFLQNTADIASALAQIRAVIDHMIRELANGEADSATMPEAEIAARFLPRVIASSLISCVQMFEEQRGLNLKHFSGAGLRDTTAPARLDPESELMVMSTVPHALAGVLRQYIEALDALMNGVTAQNDVAVTSFLMHARESACSICRVTH